MALRGYGKPPALPSDCTGGDELKACLNMIYLSMKLTMPPEVAIDAAYRIVQAMALKSPLVQKYYNKFIEEGGRAPVDKHGNIQGEQGDLGKKGAFEGKKILIGNFTSGECKTEQARAALQVKGFEVTEVATENEFIDQLDWCDVASFISATRWVSGCTPAKLLEACTKARDKGKGIWIWGDNAPYIQQCNAVLPSWFNFSAGGNTPGGKHLQAAKDGDRLSTGTFYHHAITNGIEKLFEGITICHPPTKGDQVNQDMEVLAVSNDGYPVILYRDNTSLQDTKGRVIFDCAFTKLYCNWDDAGTARYVVNGFVWLLAMEHKLLQQAMQAHGSKIKLPKMGTGPLSEEEKKMLEGAAGQVEKLPKCKGYPKDFAAWLDNLPNEGEVHDLPERRKEVIEILQNAKAEKAVKPVKPDFVKKIEPRVRKIGKKKKSQEDMLMAALVVLIALLILVINKA